MTSEVWVGTGIRRRGHGERARWRVMYGYVRPHRLALLAGGLLSVISDATALALPLVVKLLISDLGQHHGFGGPPQHVAAHRAQRGVGHHQSRHQQEDTGHGAVVA